MPWWAIDFTGSDCTETFFVFFLQWGMCEVSHSQAVDPTNCIGLYDKSGWEEVDEQSGADTHRARTLIYPWVLAMTCVALTLVVIQFLIAFMQLKKMYLSMLPQRIVLLLSVSWMLISAGTQSMGSDTYITRVSTWSYTNDCPDSLSYPAVSYYLVGTLGHVHVIALYLLINHPQRFW
jgi:hypothetical protein